MSDKSKFPTLRIDPKDVYGSWKLFVDRFSVAVRYEVCNKGTKTVGNGELAREVNIFNNEMKLCALLKAVSDEGFQALQAQGIDINSPELTYDQVMQALRNTYEREESLNVKLWNFSSARQQTGEDSRDYLRRVEHLSRTTGIFKARATDLSANQTTAANNELERVRKTMAQVIVVNGLQDLKLRRELMAQHDLTWENLCTILSCRGTAAESDEKLERPAPQVRPPVPSVPIKQEVAETRFEGYRRDGSRSRYDKFYDNRDSWRFRGFDRSSSRSRGYPRSPSRDRGYPRSPSRDRYGSSSRQGFNSSNRRGFDRNYGRDSRDRRQDNHDRCFSSRDNPYSKPRSGSREFDRRSYDSLGKSSCYHCGDTSHRIRFCPQVTCHVCFRKGHISSDCQEQSRARDSSRDSYRRNSDHPRTLRSRDPSPYPDRGRKASPNHYMDVRRVNVNPDKLFGDS